MPFATARRSKCRTTNTRFLILPWVRVPHLASHLLGRVRRRLAALPDRRTGANTTYTMEDIGLAAFSVFYTQCPSFLAQQKAMQQNKGRSNAQTLFQIEDIPSDSPVCPYPYAHQMH